MLLRLEAVDHTAFDAHLARLGPGKLTRAAAATYLESDCLIGHATCQLSSAGVRVTRCAAIPGPAPVLRAAIAFDLAPVDDALQVIDVVEFRPISLSEATAALMQRRPPWLRRSRAAREACRRLLHDEDAVFGWRRVVWAPVAALRIARTHVRLRPVVFDRGAIERQPLRWTYASAGALERWAFG